MYLSVDICSSDQLIVFRCAGETGRGRSLPEETLLSPADHKGLNVVQL